jgi:hypothetical protein
MDRKIINQLNELKLNAELRKRHIPEEYEFGICEREETEHSKIHGDTTFTYWNLALYRKEGAFGERVQQIYGTALISETAYRQTEITIETTIQQIQMGMFDKYKPFSIFEDELTSTEYINMLCDILYGKEAE